MAKDRTFTGIEWWKYSLGTVSVALGLGAASMQAMAADPVLIGVIWPTQAHARVAFESKIFAEQVAANGDQLITQYSMESAATLKNQFEAMIERGAKVIVFQAIDATAADALVEQARAAGVKTITYDRGVAKAKVDYHLTRDNYEMGQLQAQSALKAVPCGKYAIIRGDAATLAQVDMSKAYDELVKAKDCVKVVYDSLTPGWDTASAQREAEAAIQANPDLNTILIMWDTGAQASVQALKSAGIGPGKVWITGSDATPPSLKYIWDGYQGQTTWMPIDEMAKVAADAAHDLGSGVEPRTKGVMVDGVPTFYPKLTSVTKENLCEFVNKISPPGWINTDDVWGAGVNPCKQ